MYNPKKNIVALLLILSLAMSLFTVYVYSDSAPKVSAKSAALYEPQSGRFIYTKQHRISRGMASTTKIMTAILALENLSGDEIIEAEEDSCGIEGSSIYLAPGEKMSAEDLIYALILQSANDAAATLATEISGSLEEFSSLMNEKAKELSLCDTHFENPHGLDSENHYTSAHDLALLASYALKNPKFKEISSTKKRTVESSDKTRILVNHNKLLKSYDGCIGIKTGYTKKTGRSLVSAAERDSLTLICATLDAPDDWNDHALLLDYGFSMLEARKLASANEFSFTLPVLSGKSSSVTVSNKSELIKIIDRTEKTVETRIELPRFLTAPINKSTPVGKVLFYLGDKEIATLDLYPEYNVEKKKEKLSFL